MAMCRYHMDNFPLARAASHCAACRYLFGQGSRACWESFGDMPASYLDGTPPARALVTGHFMVCQYHMDGFRPAHVHLTLSIISRPTMISQRVRVHAHSTSHTGTARHLHSALPLCLLETNAGAHAGCSGGLRILLQGELPTTWCPRHSRALPRSPR